MSVQITTIVGARPQFIKHFPMDLALRDHSGFSSKLIHTGQHFDDKMSAVFFDELGMSAPDVNLGISGGSHGEMTGRMLGAIESVLLEQKPDMLMVYGDTNSTLAGALAAAKLGIAVVHIEAGLRSFNRAMPEEINRVLTDHLSHWLMCPTQTAIMHLANEGITQRVYHVGDVMMDATFLARAIARERSVILNKLGLEDQEFALATLHRAENTDDPARLRDLINWLNQKAETQTIVMPLHPRTQKCALDAGLNLDAMMCIEPVGYLDMTRLLDAAIAVFTDSGGLQKEAYFHATPCVTLRTETEWVETIDAGWNRLMDQVYKEPRQVIKDYGQGHAAAQILAKLEPA